MGVAGSRRVAEVTMELPDRESRVEPSRLRTAALMLITVVVAFLALDDITTDNASRFGFERFALLCCGAWLFLVSARLMRAHRALGLISVGLLALAAVAQREIGPGTRPGLTFEYVVIVTSLAWFAVLSGILAVLGWRSRGRLATRTGH